jgi:hypothetical protein
LGSRENDPSTGKGISTAQGIRSLVEAITLSEQVGRHASGGQFALNVKTPSLIGTTKNIGDPVAA